MSRLAKNIRYQDSKTPPIWAQDGVGRYHLMPNTGLIELDDFLPYEIQDPPGSKPRLFVPSGTLVGRTQAEIDGGVGFGIADPATDLEMFLTTRDLFDLRDSNIVPLYRPNSIVLYNFLPETLMDGSPFIPSATYDAVRQIYICWYGSD
ncbi:MAG: hypothetical protein AB4372_37035 [Xenococcus sp. (in: cyanobacteria)]